MAKKFFIIIAFFVLIFSAAPRGYAAENTVYIGIVPFYAPEKIWRLYSPFVDYLNKTTDIKWELKLFKNHEAIIKGICSDEVSIALLGPVPLGRVYEMCGARALLVALGEDGNPHYRSVILTWNPHIKSLKDIKGKPFAFFKNSTAAYVLPRKMLHDEGIDIKDIKPVFYNGQDDIINALLKQEVAAGGVKELLYERFKAFNLRVLKASEPIPNFAFCASPNINKQVAEKFMTSLLKLKPMTNKRDKNIVKDWHDVIRHGFILPPDNYLKDVLKLQEWDKKYKN